MSRNVAYSDLDVAAALILSKGSLTHAARLLKRSRRSLEGFVARHLLMSQLQEDVAAEFLDEIEMLARMDALGGDANARRYFLSTLGKGRGYSTRVETTGKDGGPVEHVEVSRDAEDFVNKVNNLKQNLGDVKGDPLPN